MCFYHHILYLCSLVCVLVCVVDVFARLAATFRGRVAAIQMKLRSWYVQFFAQPHDVAERHPITEAASTHVAASSFS